MTKGKYGLPTPNYLCYPAGRHRCETLARDQQAGELVMTRGLHKLQAIVNKAEALKDWNNIALKVYAAFGEDIVNQYRPADTDGWRMIDKKTAKLRQLLEAANEPQHQ